MKRPAPKFSGRLRLSQLVPAAEGILALPLVLLAAVLLTDRERSEPTPSQLD